MMNKSLAEQIYGYLADDEDARVCKDIPDEACREQPRSFSLQLVSQSLSKLSDTLSSAKLVLAWMLSSLGAPAIYISLLVPIRESLSLVPQLVIAQAIRELAIRKWVWVAGALGQGLALIGMVVSILNLDGEPAGVAIILLLSLFSISRGVCSVAQKDVLGKTISKSRRGRLTGTATTISGVIALGWATYIVFGPSNEQQLIYLLMLYAAAALWFVSAIVYAQLPEVPGATEGGGNALTEAWRSLALVVEDADFRAFVIARALLISTAFATPYLVVLIQQSGEGAISLLAVLIFADALAAMTSGYFWGKLSDTRAHHVMAIAAVISAATLLSAISLWLLDPGFYTNPIIGGGLLFFASVAHQGTRVGRKTYLLDLATSENRAQFTAVSNTIIGLVLLACGSVGFVDAYFGILAVLAVLTAIAMLAIGASLRLKDVSG